MESATILTPPSIGLSGILLSARTQYSWKYQHYIDVLWELFSCSTQLSVKLLIKPRISVSYYMVCASVWEDNLRALASGLSPVRTQNHTITDVVHCDVFDNKHCNINERCINALALEISDFVFIMLINVKMPTIVGSLTFMSKLNNMFSWVEHEKESLTWRPVLS